MSNDRAQILKMLKDGKISVSEAEELLDATGKSDSGSSAAPESEAPEGALSTKKSPKYLCVMVEPTGRGEEKGERVNIRVPLQLLRAGMKLASIIPDDAKGKVNEALKGKGLDLSFEDLTGNKLDELVESLADLSIDIDTDEEKVTVCCK